MYRAKLKKDLDRWTGMGLISRQAAEAMIEDHDSRAGNVNIGGVLLMLSAVLVSAAILLLVAANWQAIPRLVKVAGVILLIWGFHGGAAFCLAQGRQASGQALLVLGAASFGAALSLVGQLYHLSGDLLDMLYLWIGMASLSCLLFRSGAMAVFVGVMALALCAATLDQFDFNWTVETVWTPPLLAVLVAGLALFTRFSRVQHIAGLLLLGWLAWIYAHIMQSNLAMIYVAAGLAVFGLSALPRLARYVCVQIAGLHALLLAAMGLFILNIDYYRGVPLALVALTAVGTSIVALVLRGRHDGTVRSLAYLIFAGEVLYLSFTTIDSMLGTSGFFLIAGLIVALLAFGVTQMEKLLGSHRLSGTGKGRGLARGGDDAA